MDNRCKVSVSADGKHILEEIAGEAVDPDRDHSHRTQNSFSRHFVLLRSGNLCF